MEGYANAPVAAPLPALPRAGLRRALDALVVAALALVAAALLTAVVPRALGYGTLAVLSGSMGEEAPTGGLVLGREQARDEIALGDVIVVRRRTALGAEQPPVLHRVVALERKGAEVVVRTKGDANATADPEPYALPARVVTKAHVVPLVGYLAGFVGTKLGFLFVIAFPAIALAGSTLFRIWAPAPGAETRAPVAAQPVGAQPVAAEAPEASRTYVFFAPGPHGYWLVEASGPVPAAGAAVADDSGRRYTVAMVARSPLPDDPRPCVYLLPA